MADLSESDVFTAGVYQLELTDPVEGGPGGIDNLQAEALANRTRYLLNRITEMLKKIPRYRGYISSIDIGAGSPGDPVVKSGDVATASILSVEPGSSGIGASTTMQVTIPTMGNSNYFVRASVESRGTITDDNDALCPVVKVVNATTFQVSIQQAFATNQNLRIHLEAVSLDL